MIKDYFILNNEFIHDKFICWMEGILVSLDVETIHSLMLIVPPAH